MLFSIVMSLPDEGVITLKTLILDGDTIVEGSPEDTLVGSLLNVTEGSTLSLENNAGGRFKLDGTDIVAGATPTDYDEATSHTITVRETLAEASNSPKDTELTINVLSVESQFSLAELMLQEETEGLAIVFTDDFYHDNTGKYGSAAIKEDEE